MKVTGLIAEYNPFHNGHAYHMQQSRRITGCDYLIVVMSGDFVQRGEPAIVDKYVRARMALLGGADLVLELPVIYACGSAEFFAGGAVSLLESLGVVDSLCFGSEEGSLNPLWEAARILALEPQDFRANLRAALREGATFPAARQKALEKVLPPDALYALSFPNNILSIEYLKALIRQQSRIRPYSIPRISNGYHDAALDSLTGISSATAIRKELLNGNVHGLSAHMPQKAYGLLEASLGISCPVEANDFSLLLHYLLLDACPEDLCAYQDIHLDLANRICSLRGECSTFDAFVSLLKTRQLTETRIRRALMHLVLSIQEETVQNQIRQGWHSYVRVLGFRKSAVPLLGNIKDSCRLPLITNVADSSKVLDEHARSILCQDLRAAAIYESAAAAKFQRVPYSEYRRKLLVL